VKEKTERTLYLKIAFPPESPDLLVDIKILVS